MRRTTNTPIFILQVEEAHEHAIALVVNPRIQPKKRVNGIFEPFKFIGG
jgi:hypothetical protein